MNGRLFSQHPSSIAQFSPPFIKDWLESSMDAIQKTLLFPVVSQEKIAAMATSPGDPQAYPMCQQLTHEGQILQDMQVLMLLERS